MRPSITARELCVRMERRAAPILPASLARACRGTRACGASTISMNALQRRAYTVGALTDSIVTPATALMAIQVRVLRIRMSLFREQNPYTCKSTQ